MKRKGFKTSHSPVLTGGRKKKVRIPRKSLDKLQAAKKEVETLHAALVDAVAMIDRLTGQGHRNCAEGDPNSWTFADVKKLEAIRALAVLS